MSRTVLYLDDTLKSIRETLCVAQTALGQMKEDRAQRYRDIDLLERIIAEIDRQRPLGPDGKHGDRHTDTCGCEDKPGGVKQVDEVIPGIGRVVGVFARDPRMHIELAPGKPAGNVHLVVMERSGLLGVWLDGERAHQQARVTESVVVVLPIAADYRQPAKATGG